MSPLRKIIGWIGAIALSLAGASATASTVGVSFADGIRADGLIDWGVMSHIQPTLPPVFTIAVPGISQLNATVSRELGSFISVNQSTGWGGNFAAGEELLYAAGTNGGALNLQFDSPVQGIGAQIQASTLGEFTATIKAFDSVDALLGSYMFEGLSDNLADGSAIFIGILSSALDIVRVEFDVPTAFDPLGVQSFAINGPRIQVGAIPEPQTYALLLAGLGLLGFAARRRKMGTYPN